MNWNRLKDKILIFAEDDYLFADMFISIINSYQKVKSIKDLQIFTYNMIMELMNENLINIYLLKMDEDKVVHPIKYTYNNDKSKRKLITLIDEEWKKLNYQLPSPSDLFWVSYNKS